MNEDKQINFHKALFESRFDMITRLDKLLSGALYLQDLGTIKSLTPLRLGLYRELLNLVDRQVVTDRPSWEGWAKEVIDTAKNEGFFEDERNAYEEVVKNAES